jgi:hypothetical protein
MCDATKLKEKLQKEREPIISSGAKEKMQRIFRDPVKSKKFLQDAGILDKQGQLSSNYR